MLSQEGGNSDQITQYTALIWYFVESIRQLRKLLSFPCPQLGTTAPPAPQCKQWLQTQRSPLLPRPRHQHQQHLSTRPMCLSYRIHLKLMWASFSHDYSILCWPWLTQRDSGYGNDDDDDAASTISVDLTIYQFEQENGRTYHKYCAGRKCSVFNISFWRYYHRKEVNTLNLFRLLFP